MNRFRVISSVIGDVNANIISIAFYFTILMPFGLVYTLFADPLRRKHFGQTAWLEREAVPTDIQSARQQG